MCFFATSPIDNFPLLINATSALLIAFDFIELNNPPPPASLYSTGLINEIKEIPPEIKDAYCALCCGFKPASKPCWYVSACVCVKITPAPIKVEATRPPPATAPNPLVPKIITPTSAIVLNEFLANTSTLVWLNFLYSCGFPLYFSIVFSACIGLIEK